MEYDPEIVVQHYQGSSSAFRPCSSIVAFHYSAWRYQRRHGGGGSVMLGTAAIGLTARAVVKLLANAARRLLIPIRASSIQRGSRRRPS